DICEAETRLLSRGAPLKSRLDGSASRLVALGSVYARHRVVHEFAHVLLERTGGFVAQLVLRASHLGGDLPRGACEPAIARIKASADQSQGKNLWHSAPPGAALSAPSSLYNPYLDQSVRASTAETRSSANDGPKANPSSPDG